MDWKTRLVKRFAFQYEGRAEGDCGGYIRSGGREPGGGRVRADDEGAVKGVQGQAAGVPTRGASSSRALLRKEDFAH